MPVAAAIGGALISGVAAKKAADTQAEGAQRAADAQTQASRESLQLQREIYDDTTARYAPYVTAGGAGRGAYMYELGLGERPMIGGRPAEVETIQIPASPQPVSAASAAPMGWGNALSGAMRQRPGATPAQPVQQAPQGSTQYRVNGKTFTSLEDANAYAAANPVGGTAYRGFKETPGYQFQLDQGLDAVKAMAATRGGFRTPRTAQALMTFGQGLANQEYGNYMNRLAGVTDMGMGAAGNQAQAGNALAANGGNTIMAGGNAAANGFIGAANAGASGIAGIGNAFTSGIQNGIGAWQYQKNLANGLKPAGWV